MISIIIFFLLFFAGDIVQAGILSAELETALQFAGPDDEIPVIVNLRDKADIHIFQEREKGLKRSQIIKTLKNTADLTQRDLKALLVSKGAKRLKQLWMINGIAATVSPPFINELRNKPEIKSVRLDGMISLPIPVAGTVEQSPAEWNISAVHAPEMWASGFTGQKIIVANMDTGVDIDHPDLEGRWRRGSNSWFNPYADACAPPVECSPCDASDDIPCDSIGHGTGTMGIMVGGSAGGSGIGVAPDSQWIAVKVFNDSGKATYSAIHQGFQWLLDPDGNPTTDDAPDVVNISWGFDENPGECITEFQTDTEVLKTVDIAVVYSAGNAGSQQSTSVSPANYPRSFSAGATTVNNVIAFFSSRGPSACDGSISPKVVAPGVNIKTSTVSDGGFLNYDYVSGTSFSAPHIAGAMALLLSAYPESTVSELEWALKYSAVDLGSPGADNFYGYGAIDALGAYHALRSLNPSILFSPLSFDFRSVETGDRSLPATFHFVNDSKKAVKINSVLISGRNASEFLIWHDSCTGKAILPSYPCFLEALFSPLSRGTKDAEIEISFADLGMTSASLLVSGNSFLCPVSFQDLFAGHWAKAYIENLYCNRITVGCSVEPLMFCPDDSVLRTHLAAFIIRALFGEDFLYDQIPHFSDVSRDHWAFKYIQKMCETGISIGYGDDTYRPANPVSRAHAARFIVRAIFGEDFTYNGIPYFSDVPENHWAFKYIQKMYEAGITTGYEDGTYRPANTVKRGQMAAFLARAFLGMP